MEEIKNWILLGTVGVLSTVCVWMIKTGIEKMLGKMDEIVKELQHLNTTTALHGQDIRNLQEADGEINKRLNNHSDRLRQIEIKVRPDNTNHVET